MGLDMYAYKTREKFASPVDFPVTSSGEELAYWRKHPNLHGWMEQLYREKGGRSEHFNVSPVVLTPDDLDRLETDLRTGNLPYTQGFFFGESRGDEWENDIKFVKSAREAIDEGFTVYYTSWW